MVYTAPVANAMPARARRVSECLSPKEAWLRGVAPMPTPMRVEVDGCSSEKSPAKRRNSRRLSGCLSPNEAWLRGVGQDMAFFPAGANAQGTMSQMAPLQQMAPFPMPPSPSQQMAPFPMPPSPSCQIAPFPMPPSPSQQMAPFPMPPSPSCQMAPFPISPVQQAPVLFYRNSCHQQQMSQSTLPPAPESPRTDDACSSSRRNDHQASAPSSPSSDQPADEPSQQPAAMDPRLVTRLQRELDSDAPDVAIAAGRALQGRALALALESQETSMLLQQALERCPLWLAAELKTELHGHVRELIRSQHGNYVVQKVVELLPRAQASVVVRELVGDVQYFARHRFGCRVLCRLVEQYSASRGPDGPEGPDFQSLMAELLHASESLCRHTYAHHVLESVLEHGAEPHRRRVFEALQTDTLRNAKDRYAGFVIQAALAHCPPEERDALAAGILGSDATAHLLQLSETRFGARLVESLAKVEVARPAVMHTLRAHANALAQSKQGRRLTELLAPSQP